MSCVSFVSESFFSSWARQTPADCVVAEVSVAFHHHIRHLIRRIFDACSPCDYLMLIGNMGKLLEYMVPLWSRLTLKIRNHGI